jgi:Domain of unknown function (DUF4350)
MRRSLPIIVTLALVIGVLIAINAASYVRVEKTRDSEFSPDRSTFNSGPTGTRALYDFMREAGYQVARWREAPETLLSTSGSKPATLVIVGRQIVPVRKEEGEVILRWVNEGGRLVIIDREPTESLVPRSGQWTITTYRSQFPWDVDAADFEQMTAGVKPISPAQPTILSADVQTILPSRFAADLKIVANANPKDEHPKRTKPEVEGAATESPAPEDSEGSDGSEYEDEESSPLKGIAGSPEEGAEEEGPSISPAPVVHFAQDRGALLIDYPHGKGRIVLLSDPFIVANNGISRADNLQLALNTIAGYGGLIAFDEFHQGHETTHNALIQYFAGTPVLALCGQLALIAVLIVWSRGRRFARPLPLPQVDRRSSLEFVASMAELQQRARAYDLALENIYARVRRVLVRYAGVSNNSPRAEVARRVALRSRVNQQELETLMRSCEDTINGTPTTSRRSLDLARRLRAIEAALGLRMRSRETRQAAEKV